MSLNHTFRKERRAEADLNPRPSAYQPSALPLGQTSLRLSTEEEGAFTYNWKEGENVGLRRWRAGGEEDERYLSSAKIMRAEYITTQVKFHSLFLAHVTLYLKRIE